MDEKEEDVKEKRKGQIQTLVAFSLILILILSHYYYTNFYILEKNGQITKGYVYDISLSNGMKFVYRFCVDGREYRGGSNMQTKSTALVGDSITIIYNPDNPENSNPACDVLDKYVGVK